MRKIKEIEKQIQKLSREEVAELREWFLEQDWKTWDTQIEADIKAGKLDRLVYEAEAEYAAGTTFVANPYSHIDLADAEGTNEQAEQIPSGLGRGTCQASA